MKHIAPTVFAAALLLAGSALAQSTTITTGPNGALSGSVSVPGQPPMSVHAGGGSVSTSPSKGARSAASPSYGGPGRSVTVRSRDGRSSASAYASGDNAVVAGAGSPGSRIATRSHHRQPRACPRGASRAYRARTHCWIARR